MVFENRNIPSLTEDRETFLPAVVDTRNRLRHVIFGADDRVHGTPARLERIVESGVLLAHLGLVAGEGFGLFVVGPLERGKKFSSEYSQFSKLSGWDVQAN
jgi:hypothetical protein